MKNKQVEAFILAGGKSSRMGKDKGLISICGKPMVQHLIEKVDRLGMESSIISSNPEYLVFGKPVHQDKIVDRGPMGGLYTAMMASRASKILILSCDIPLIPIDALSMIVENHQKFEICVSSISGQLNPLLSCYRSALFPKVFESIRAGNLKVQNFIKSSFHKVIELDGLAQLNPGAFTNFNYIEDLV